MKKIMLSLLFLLLWFNAFGQDTLQFDGSYWVNLTENEKAVFIVGMAHGEHLVGKILYDSKETAILEFVSEKLSDERTIEKTIKAIDQFYKDNPKYVNVPVFIVYALTLDASKIK